MLTRTGPHGQRKTAQAAEWFRRAAIGKAVDDVELLKLMPDHAWRIYRRYFAIQDLWLDPWLAAQIILQGLKGYRHPKLIVEACYNEIPREWTREHATFITRLAGILKAEGLLTCGPSWATGAFEREDWEYMRSRGWCGLDFISLHGYWAWHGRTRWNALRYRQFWQPGDPPIVLTEWGRDRVRDGENGEYEGAAGYLADGLSPWQFGEELLAADGEIAQDPAVLGALVFTFGPEPDWADRFDCDRLSLEQLLPGAQAPLNPIARGQTSSPDQTGGQAGMTNAEIEAKLQHLERQNALLTDALRAIRQNKWTGADGVDGIIVAMQGGKPLDFAPSFPKA